MHLIWSVAREIQEAIIVDPGRDIDQYLITAKNQGVRIVAVAETHIHADYVSGARELAERVDARLFVSDEGPDDWKYHYVTDYDSQLLKDRDIFDIGNISFEVLLSHRGHSGCHNRK